MASSASDQPPLEKDEWPAVLLEDFRADVRVFPAGHRFMVQEYKYPNGTIRLRNWIKAIPSGMNQTIAIPTSKLKIGTRPLSAGIHYKRSGVSVETVSRDLTPASGIAIETHEPFGEFFLKLALAVRTNVSNLKQLDIMRKPLRLLEDKFADTFMSIYSAVPEEIKSILSEEIIDITHLPYVTRYDEDMISEDIGTIPKGLLIYLRIYFETEEEDAEEAAEVIPEATLEEEVITVNTKLSIYVGMTGDLAARNQGHLNCAQESTPRNSHYATASRARETRVIVLCRPETMERSTVFLAEQLFVLFFNCYQHHLGSQRITEGSLRNAQVQILNEIRRIGLGSSHYQPIFARQPAGLNAASPLEMQYFQYVPPLWTCKEYLNRWQFIISKPRTLMMKKGRITFLRFMSYPDGSAWHLFLPRNARLAFQGSKDRQVVISVEIMKGSQAHPFPFARAPEIGPISNFALANTVAIMIAGRDSSDKLRGFYCQVARPEFSVDVTIDDKQLLVPQGYVNAMMLRSSLLGPPYGHSIDPKLRGKFIKIWEIQHKFLEHETNLILRMQPSSTFLPKPQITSLAENREYLEKTYKLNFEPPKSSKKARPCDLCFMLGRFWQAVSRQTTQSAKAEEACNVVDGVCQKWKNMNIPASWSSNEQLQGDLKDLFFKKLAKQPDDLLPEDSETFNVQLDSYKNEISEEDIYRARLSDVDALEEPIEPHATMEEGFVSESEDEEDRENMINAQQSSGALDDDDEDNDTAVEEHMEDVAPALPKRMPKAMRKLNVSKGDKILVILRSKREEGQTWFLVIFNDLLSDAVWVDIERLAHEVELLGEYWKVSKTEHVPEWARGIPKRKRASADSNDSEEDSMEASEESAEVGERMDTAEELEDIEQDIDEDA